MGPYKWHSQLFELFFVWLPTWGYLIGVTPNNIDSQAQVEHHSITGDWEGPNFLGEQIINQWFLNLPGSASYFNWGLRGAKFSARTNENSIIFESL